MKIRCFKTSCIIAITLLSYSVWGQQSISLSKGIHSKQTSGYTNGVSFRYQYNEVLALKSGYFQADNVEVAHDTLLDSNIKHVDYQHWLIGAEFLHQQSEWYLSLGAGFDVITQSNQTSLIAQGGLSPYLSFGASYPLSQSWRLSLEQYFHFNASELGNYQTTQLGIQYRFNSNVPKSPVRAIELTANRIDKSTKTHLMQSTIAPLKPEISHSRNDENIHAQCWVIQWGVFTLRENANTFKQRISKLNINPCLVKKADVVHIISHCYQSKEAAIFDNELAIQLHNIHGYVRLQP